jgi:hypothetical protein
MRVQNCNLSPSFQIKLQPTKIINYATNKYLTKDKGCYKGCEVTITKNFIDNQLTSKLIYLKDTTGKWLKSKLKYFEEGQWKVLESRRNEVMV